MDKERFTVIKDEIVAELASILEKGGMYYRIFARAKTEESIIKKLDEKGDSYRMNQKKMQDLIGVRIAFYFQDDVSAFHKKIQNMVGYDSKNESNSHKDLAELNNLIEQMSEIDESNKILKKKLNGLIPLQDKVFMPERLNLIIYLSDRQKEFLETELSTITTFDTSLIDYTYELQLRTILSEGWHEVEHDLRYKTIHETWWNYCKEESRMLNGLYASLVTSEGALSQMIDEITYKNYHNHNWDAMIRFHFRRRTSGQLLSPQLCSILDANDRIAKDILHVSREDIIKWLWEINTNVTITTDLLLFLVNRKVLNIDSIRNLEPLPIKNALDYKG